MGSARTGRRPCQPAPTPRARPLQRPPACLTPSGFQGCPKMDRAWPPARGLWLRRWGRAQTSWRGQGLTPTHVHASAGTWNTADCWQQTSGLCPRSLSKVSSQVLHCLAHLSPGAPPSPGGWHLPRHCWFSPNSHRSLSALESLRDILGLSKQQSVKKMLLPARHSISASGAHYWPSGRLVRPRWQVVPTDGGPGPGLRHEGPPTSPAAALSPTKAEPDGAPWTCGRGPTEGRVRPTGRLSRLVKGPLCPLSLMSFSYGFGVEELPASREPGLWPGADREGADVLGSCWDSVSCMSSFPVASVSTGV